MAALPSVARAGGQTEVHIPAGPLDRAISTLSRELGVDIVSTEPGLSQRRVAALDGRLSAAKALAKLLAGSGYRARRAGSGYRIVAAPKALAMDPPRPRPATDGPDIVVTASKQRIDLRSYPATAHVVDLASTLRYQTSEPDSDTLAQAIPVIEQTALGPGRNKLFVRGIADSSFTGATQSTVSLYFGDVPLTYSGADPDLKLVDVARVEVLEGPQGTLYGSGAIGGIIRITPNAPDLTRVSARIGAGVSDTIGGSPGYDGDATVNLPVVRDLVATRVTAYREREGGFIDDRQRKINDVNTTTTTGARFEVRATPGTGWEVTGGGVWQQINTDDLGYVQLNTPPFTRRSRLAQPFAGRFLQGHATLVRRWSDGLELTSAFGWASTRQSETFDASSIATAGTIYLNEIDSRLLTLESRLSHKIAHGSWVVGAVLLRNVSEQNRALASPTTSTEIVGVTNVAQSASVFGEYTRNLTPHLSATLGVRGTIGRNEATPSVRQPGSAFFGGQRTERFDPTLAISYRLNSETLIYGRAQTGYRTGGLAVARGAGRIAEFQPDSIVMGEIGIRYHHVGAHPFNFSSAIAYSRWDNIQADLFSLRGQPFTTTLGNATIASGEISASWEPIAGLRAETAILITDNYVSGPIANTSVKNNRRLAQVPPVSGDAALSYRWAKTEVAVTTHYVGRAVLGTGDTLDISQDPYVLLGARLKHEIGRAAITLSGDNLLNSHANRFALGNPLMLAARNQFTPLRPLTIRLGAEISF
ncbi:TonB-dependent receptor [Sphingomonas sp. GlSt437]|uniref:TonB-dependent receptor n=2 Tax=Bacteria TaxID=2 RepID=UPI003EB8AEC7